MRRDAGRTLTRRVKLDPNGANGRWPPLAVPGLTGGAGRHVSPGRGFHHRHHAGQPQCAPHRQVAAEEAVGEVVGYVLNLPGGRARTRLVENGGHRPRGKPLRVFHREVELESVVPVLLHPHVHLGLTVGHLVIRREGALGHRRRDLLELVRVLGEQVIPLVAVTNRLELGQ